jgi:hypothetical protein
MRISPTYAHHWGAGWIAAEPPFMRRASHALAHEGSVWLIDPVDGEGLDAILEPLGTVRAVVQLLDRHERDCAVLAARHGVPHLVTPTSAVAGAPFEVVPVVHRRWWHESALWWPGPNVLVVAEALGTAPYYRAPGTQVGVHAMLRLFPPRGLARFPADVLLPGHGEPLEGDAHADIRRALEDSRRDIPGVVRSMIRGRRER